MRDDNDKLEKILECIDQIREYTKDGRDAFFTDRKTQDAVVRNLQVIGQAVKDLSQDLKLKDPYVPWKEAAGIRDKVTHDYFDVDYDKVWATIEDKLGPLREKIEDIHRRLVYKVPENRDPQSKLGQKLKDRGNPQMKIEDVFKIKQPEAEKKKERDRDDDLTR